MCDSESGMCASSCEFPVRQIFFSPQNVQLIAKMIQRRTGLSPQQVTGESLEHYMRPIFEVANGSILRDPKAIVEHVHVLNTKVAEWAATEAVIGNKFNDHYLKLITGTRPLIDRPVQAVGYGQTRNTPFLLRDYTQFFDDGGDYNIEASCTRWSE